MVKVDQIISKNIDRKASFHDRNTVEKISIGFGVEKKVPL